MIIGPCGKRGAGEEEGGRCGDRGGALMDVPAERKETHGSLERIQWDGLNEKMGNDWMKKRRKVMAKVSK